MSDGKPTARGTEGAGRGRLAALVMAVVAFLPFARGLASGACLYFRDLSSEFFPLRRFAVQGLWRGEVRHWNPFVHEGEPLTLPAISYPIDLLHLLLSDEWGFSLLLALHVPLAAVALFVLARALGASPVAAAGGGLVYALGGFCLSTVNLYRYAQATAWAPLVIWAGLRAAGERRGLPRAALLVAVAFSTTGVEIVLLALIAAAVLATASCPPDGRGRAILRLSLAALMGGGLAGAPMLLLRDFAAHSARGPGFPPDVVLAHSVHPLTLVQVLVAHFYGDPSDLTRLWWGQNFFPLGFPYFLSLYLGPAALSLAAVGVLHAGRHRGPLAAVLVLGLVASLGRFAGLQELVEALPILRVFRYPSKAFFLVHLGVALLAALGLEALAGPRRAARPVAVASLGLGGVLGIAPLLPNLAPRFHGWFVAGFFPAEHAWPQRLEEMRHVLGDARSGAWFALAVGGLAVGTAVGRIRARTAATATVALLAADLLRAGVGLNPMVTASFYAPSEESRATAAKVEGGRLFTCGLASSPTYLRARDLLERSGYSHEAWSFAVKKETLTPFFNMSLGVRSALSEDVTMLTPVGGTLSPHEASCAGLPGILPRLRAAGVSHILSADDLPASPELVAPGTIAPDQIAPLRLHVRELRAALPLRVVVARAVSVASAAEAVERAGSPGFQADGGTAVEAAGVDVEGASGRVLRSAERPDELRVEVEASRSTFLLVRDAFAPGWSATVNGRVAPLYRADGRHRAVPVPEGLSLVVMRYRPPALTAGLWVSAAAALGLGLVLWFEGRRRRSLTP